MKAQVAFVWLMILITIAVMSFVYIIFTEILSGYWFPFAHNNMATTVPQVQNIIDLFENSWWWFIVVFIFSLFLYGIMKSLHKESYTGYY